MFGSVPIIRFYLNTKYQFNMRKRKKQLMRRIRFQYLEAKEYEQQMLRALEQGFISGRAKQCQN